MSFGIGLGAFTDGLMKGRAAMQQMRAAAVQNQQGAETGQTKPALVNPVESGSGQGLGALVNGFINGRNSATQAAAAKSNAMGGAQPPGAQQQQQGGGMWSALANALGMQANPTTAASTGMTSAAEGAATTQSKSIYDTYGLN